MKDPSTLTDDELRARYDEVISLINGDLEKENTDPENALPLEDFDKLFDEAVSIIHETIYRKSDRILGRS